MVVEGDGAGGVGGGVGAIAAEGRGEGMGRRGVALVRGWVGTAGDGGEPSHANKQSKNSVLEMPIQRKRSCCVIGWGFVGVWRSGAEGMGAEKRVPVGA